jgi:pimeloyl-ACP methyl ester carboxylesterase
MPVLPLLLALASVLGQPQEVVRIPSFDGETIEGRLDIPSLGFKNTIVIDIPSSGPQTYENMRRVGRNTIFKYHNFYRDEFSRRGIAYFSYSTRYTLPDPANPPNYDKVEKEKFFSYTPSVKLKDLEEIVRFLKKDARLASSRFILLGFSEGAIIAAMLAEGRRVPVDALFLAGTPTDNAYETIRWQLSGKSSMINFRKFFDSNKDRVIQKAEYEEADPRAIARAGGKSFSELDRNADSVLTEEDFRLILAPQLGQILAAVEKGDNEWIWNSFFRVGTPWIKEHRTLEPNKARIMKLELPVYLFHGSDDANCPVEGIMQIQKEAQEKNKRNIRVFIFPGHDHTLEFLGWVVTKSLPDGLKALFQEIENF